MTEARIPPSADDAMPTSHAGWIPWRDVDASVSPAVSVIVPAGDGDDDLVRRLPGVLAQTTIPHEVVVVDTSRDGRHFSTFVRFEQLERRTVIRYLRSPLAGRRALRRLVAGLAAGNVKAFAWAGSAIPSTWVERIVERVRMLRSVAVAGV